MAKIRVIKVDEKINIDQMAVRGCDMTGIPEEVWALQWDDSHGHISYVDGLKPNLIVSSESEVEAGLGVSLSTLTERYNTRLAEVKIEKEEAEAALNDR